MTRPDDPQRGRPRRRSLLALAVLIGAAIGFAGIYGIGGFEGNADPACRPSLEAARRIAPLVRGEVAAIAVATKPLNVASLAYRDENGQGRSLADRHGRFTLLNLWATWCPPCRQEMPALEALQDKLGNGRFQVVAVNIDTRDPDKPKAFLRDIGVRKLAHYTDPSAKIFQDLKAAGRAFGMPTTMLVGPDGCEIGTLAGPAEWASDDALALIRAAIGE
ncbi:MAG: TlpA family protein disulfide reductase [Pseudorhodoplanes sp.]